MRRLEFDKFTLEEFSLDNDRHVKIIDELMRDRMVQRELYITMEQFIDRKKSFVLPENNCFIVLVEEIPIGYIETSPISNGSISLSIAILKMFRRKGYGHLVLNAFTDYLLEREYIDRVSAIISDKNEPSIETFEKSGFSKSISVPGCYEKTKFLKK